MDLAAHATCTPAKRTSDVAAVSVDVAVAAAAAAAAAASSAITGWDIGIRRLHCEELFYSSKKFLA